MYFVHFSVSLTHFSEDDSIHRSDARHKLEQMRNPTPNVNDYGIAFAVLALFLRCLWQKQLFAPMCHALI